MLDNIIHWLESHLSTCPFHKYLGIDCLGCGMQRAFIELLKGNLKESIQQYPALIPMLLLISFLIIHLKFRLRWGALILKSLFMMCVCIIVFSYIYKHTNY